MDKKKENTKNLITVTKENFQKCIIDFKNYLNNESLEYVIFNNEISTMNFKYMEEYGEIIFSEFTICYNGKHTNDDIENNELFYITYLIPSIKYHKFSEEEFISFNHKAFKSLYDESNLYSLKKILNSNSLSYENIHKKNFLEKKFDSILKEGKPFAGENKKSYNYFPKAIELPSKKFQKRFEEIIKQLVEINFEKDENKKKYLDENDKIYFYNTDLYESNYKILYRLFNFKWNLIFDNLDEQDTFKIKINSFKIEKIKKKLKIKSDYISFIENIIDFLKDEDNNNIDFDINIRDKYFNEELLNNWKKYIELEDKYIDFAYEIDIDKTRVKFNLKKSKNSRIENILKILQFIKNMIDIGNDDFNYDKKEFCLDEIIYKKFNMINLFTKKVKKRIIFSYHIIPIIDSTKFKLNKTKEEYISKINYKNLLIRKSFEEEILFGKNITTDFEELFSIDNKNEGFKALSIDFAYNLNILLANKEFNDLIKLFFSKLEFLAFDKKWDKYYSIYYKKNEKFKEDFNIYFQSIINLAKITKKNIIINEEIGLSYFYEEIFSKKNINIYGVNLKNNIYFSIRKLLLKKDLNAYEEIEKIISQINIYDLSYICKDQKINFYFDYLNLKKTYKDLSLTQKLHFIIQNNEFLRNKQNLIKYKNKFYLDNLDKFENKPYYNISKEKFYEKSDKIINIIKEKIDFTITESNENNDFLQINFIDSNKFNELENLKEILNKIC